MNIGPIIMQTFETYILGSKDLFHANSLKKNSSLKNDLQQKLQKY